MTKIEVGRVYAIQAKSFTFGDTTLEQDSVIEIRSIDSGVATFWSSQDGAEHKCDVGGLKWVI